MKLSSIFLFSVSTIGAATATAIGAATTADKGSNSRQHYLSQPSSLLRGSVTNTAATTTATTTTTTTTTNHGLIDRRLEFNRDTINDQKDRFDLTVGPPIASSGNCAQIAPDHDDPCTQYQQQCRYPILGNDGQEDNLYVNPYSSYWTCNCDSNDQKYSCAIRCEGSSCNDNNNVPPPPPPTPPPTKPTIMNEVWCPEKYPKNGTTCQYPGIDCDYGPPEVPNVDEKVNCECQLLTSRTEASQRLWVCKGDGWEGDVDFYEVPAVTQPVGEGEGGDGGGDEVVDANGDGPAITTDTLPPPPGEDIPIGPDSESCPDGFPLDNVTPCSEPQQVCGPYQVSIPEDEDEDDGGSIITSYQTCSCSSTTSLFKCIEVARSRPQQQQQQQQQVPVQEQDPQAPPAVPVDVQLLTAIREPTVPTTIVSGPIISTNSDDCPFESPESYDDCTGSSKGSNTWSQCQYAVEGEFRKRWTCNCGADSKFHCALRGLA